MCGCICVCSCLYMCVHMYACRHVYVCMYLCVYVCECICVSVPVCMPMCTCVGMHVCAHVCSLSMWQLVVPFPWLVGSVNECILSRVLIHMEYKCPMNNGDRHTLRVPPHPPGPGRKGSLQGDAHTRVDFHWWPVGSKVLKVFLTSSHLGGPVLAEATHANGFRAASQGARPAEPEGCCGQDPPGSAGRVDPHKGLPCRSAQGEGSCEKPPGGFRPWTLS